MAGPFIGNLFFECEGRGWTETYYPNGGDYTTCMVQMQAVNTNRQALSLSDVICVNIRVSDMTVRGDSLNAIATTHNGTYVESGAVTLDPDIALLVRETSDDFLRRALRYLRGLPNTVITTTPLTYLAGLAPTPWKAALSTWKAYILGQTDMVHRAPGPVFTTSTIGTITDERATIRRAGRPFGQQPGRRVRA